MHRRSLNHAVPHSDVAQALHCVSATVGDQQDLTPLEQVLSAEFCILAGYTEEATSHHTLDMSMWNSRLNFGDPLVLAAYFQVDSKNTERVTPAEDEPPRTHLQNKLLSPMRTLIHWVDPFSLGHSTNKLPRLSESSCPNVAKNHSKNAIVKMKKYALRYLCGQERLCRISGLAQRITPAISGVQLTERALPALPPDESGVASGKGRFSVTSGDDDNAPSTRSSATSATTSMAPGESYHPRTAWKLSVPFRAATNEHPWL